jgi:hypothetical protein
MLKIVLINQPCGLGDILFCQKIGKHYLEKGHRVVWPVIPEYSYVGEYLKDIYYPNVRDNFVGQTFYYQCRASQTKTIQENNNFIYVPLDGQYRGGSVMTSKYKAHNMEWNDWKDYLNIFRNEQRENKLYNELGLEGKEYILVNDKYGSPPNEKTKIFDINTDKHIVRMFKTEHIFDWFKVIENASEIWSVETVFNYLIEMIKFKAIRLELFSKWTPSDYSHVRELFNVNWNYNT